MGLKRAMLNAGTSVLRCGVRLATGGQSARVLAHLSEQLAPVVDQKTSSGSLKFYCPGEMPAWRADTLLTKEPETLEWIDGFGKADVLWDVGANVGVYSLYAALRGIKVCAFEPSPGNFYVLSRNIEVNSFDNRISSYCIAFNDETRLDSFHMAGTELGGALSSFGEAIDYKGELYVAKFKQAMLGFAMDDFVRQLNPSFPNHIKIDVDGIEKKIVRGAMRTLADTRVKSVLIELNTDLAECAEVIDLLGSCGLSLHKREHADMYYSGAMKGIYNHIFLRKA